MPALFRSSMGFARFLPVTATALATVFATMLSTDARASDEVEVHVEHGQLVVHVRGEWHINPDYPWKLSVGDAKLDRTHFVFDEKTARVDGAPSGKGALRGGVCAGTKCKSFTEEIEIP